MLVRKFEEEYKNIAHSYLADNSHRSYLTGKRAFVKFMLRHGYAPIVPASDRHIALFVVFLVQRQKLLVSSAKQYLFGVRALHLESGQEWKVWSERFLVYQAFRACKRLFGERINEGRPTKLEITFRTLLDLRKAAFSTDVVDRTGKENVTTFWAVCLVLFFGLLRKDNVTVAKKSAFNPNRCLAREDFSFDPHGNIQLKLRWSKVIQFSERYHVITYVRTGGILCPCKAIKAAFATTPPHASHLGPAFQWKVGRQFSPLTHATFTRFLKKCIDLTGRESANYSGISFRRGGASAGALLGADHELIKELGDWKSDAYLRYTRRPVKQRLALPRMLAEAATKAARA